jgi:hypothetical protein
MVRRALAGVAAATVIVAGTVSANASSLWIDDTAGNIGLVDTATGTIVPGTLHNTGQILTDIGFIGTQMYGTTFTSLFTISTATGASTLVGTYGAQAGGGMNALVGNGSSLLGASNAVNTVFNINPANAALSNFATPPLPSAGDLAFASGTLYESGVSASGADALVNVSTGTVVGLFHTSSISSFNAVFGLADDGTSMFAVDGTNIYSVNLSNALLTPLSNYGGHGLIDANGTAFLQENVNVPGPIVGAGLPGLIAACGGLVALVRRRRKLVA